MQRLFFGKLPAHGDFVARGLEIGAQQRWDQAISTAMEQGRSHFGALFEQLYVRAAPWRCLLPADDGRWLAGALAPSVDRAGRYFPAFLVARVPDTVHGECVARLSEALLFEAINHGWTVDELLTRFDGAEMPIAPESPSGIKGWWPDGHGQLPVPIAPRSCMGSEDLVPEDLLIAMLGVAEQLS